MADSKGNYWLDHGSERVKYISFLCLDLHVNVPKVTDSPDTLWAWPPACSFQAHTEGPIVLIFWITEKRSKYSKYEE